MSNQSPDTSPQAVNEDRRSLEQCASNRAWTDIESMIASVRESLTIGHREREKIQQTLDTALDSSLRLTTFPTPMTFSAKHLENKLWSGYSDYAIRALEALKLDDSASSTERQLAAYQLARRCILEGEYARALANIELAKSLAEALTPQLIITETRCLLLLGRSAEALTLIDEAAQRKSERDYLLLRSTIVRHREIANGRTPEQVDTAHLAALNAVFQKTGLMSVQKRNSDAQLSIDNLICHAPDAAAPQNPKLSIIVPTFNAANSIEWVLASIREQTWRNLEIVVVDDKSTDATVKIVTRISTLDPRVRLVRQSSNRGTYAARNAGVRVATGDLIMVHGSDDWSHPQRMELQINCLKDNPSAIASLSFFARVNENIEVQSSWDIAPALMGPNFSSLMFRRACVEKVGLWDEVSVGGDDEFLNRLKTVFGMNSVIDLPKKHLLSLSLAREESLAQSAATHISSVKYGLRWNYRDSYTFWHTKAAQAGKPLLGNTSVKTRNYPVPVGNRHGYTSTAPYDLIVIGDFASKGTAFESNLDHLKNAGKNSRKIAAFHWRHYESTSKDSLQPAFYETCLRYSIDILSPCDIVSADTLLINPPAILQYRLDPLPKFHAERVAVWVDLVGSPLELKRYDPLVVRAHLQSIFGTEGIWIAASARVKRLMRNDPRFPVPAHISALTMLGTTEPSAPCSDEK